MTASEHAMGRYMRAPDHPRAEDEFAAAFDTLAAEDNQAAAPPPPPAAGEGGDAGSGGADGAGDAGAQGAAGDGGDGTGGAGGDGAAAAAPAADDKGGAAAADDKAGAAAAAAEAAGTDQGAAGAADAAAAAGDGADGKNKDKAGEAAAAPPPPSAEDAAADAVLKRLAKVVAETPVDDKPAGDAAADELPALYTEDEQKLLEEHDKEWGDLSRGEALKRRAEYRALMGHVFSEVEKVFGPVRDIVQGLATRTHVADIKEKVGDYTPQDVDNVTAWAKTQPKYLQDAYLGVIEGGTADEVADLVSRYREATGQPKAGASEAAAASPGGDVELSDEAKQAAAGLAPVDSKRSVVRQPGDPLDFDGAWDSLMQSERA